ncbi:carbohydrate kinase family protein [Neobacillus niacini]|uniref:carbohydrate kinase family protein n=1 Tax=Neobacillus niacini TaxID=86668 RepID=UPI0021CB0EBA|nr:carbohydrate kinase family protein [Neobacillus niacini]MCM3765000.1 carbohydrate kinase family protein [Neobacillus niacini]
MNNLEAMVLEMVKSNQFISEQQISEKTGLSQAETGIIISSLIQSGKIIGRAFVLPEEKKVLCIGGANIDRKIQVLDQLKFGTSNPSVSTKSKGGVARNVAENLGRLGITTSLLAYIGEDTEGEWLLQETKDYVNMNPTKIINGKSTGTYTAVLDTEGEMTVALADMAIYDEVEESFLERNWHHLQNSEMVFLDTNFPISVIHQVIESCRKADIPICISTVSASKTKKLPASLEGVTWLIANHKEAEALSDLEIRTEGDFFRAAEVILRKGAERVVITRGNQGLIYFTKDGRAGALVAPEIPVIDVTGAGDSLTAGILFGHLKGLHTEDSCKLGLACSLITIQSNETVNPELNSQKLISFYQKYFTTGVTQRGFL